MTTIEGLATNGELHPIQQAFHEQHGLQCGYCTPGMVMATVSLLEENPKPDRGGDPRTRSRATSAAAPATTTSSRPSRPRRGRRSWPPPRRTSARRSCARRTRSSSPARAATSTTSTLPGMLLDGARAQPVRARADRRAWTSRPRAERARRRRRVHRRRPRRRVGRAGFPCAWPVTDDIEMPAALAARDRQGALRGRRRRRGRRREPRRGAGRRRARRGRVRAAPGRDRRRGRARRRRARSSTTTLPSNKCYAWPLETGDVGQGRSPTPTVDRQGALPPAAADPAAIEPRGVLCAAVDRRPGELTIWSATQVPHILRTTLLAACSASPRRSCA